MLLGSNNSLALIGIGQCSLGIKGFDGVEVDNSGADALGLQRIRCLQSFRDHQSGGKDRHIRAILHHVGLAGDKGGVLLGVHIGHRTCHADVHRTLDVDCCLNRLTGLNGVAGYQNGHVGHNAHQGNVFHGLMAAAVLAHAQSAVAARHLDVGVDVGNAVADLLVGAAGGEHGERVDEGLEAAQAHTGGDADHIGLGDAHIKETLRAGGLEELRHGRAGEVCVEADKIGIFVGQGGERLAVSLTGCDFFSHCLTLQFLDLRFELCLGLGPLLIVGRLAVPAGVVFHEAHTFALDGLGEDHGGLTLGLLGFLVSGFDLVKVVAVDLDDVPAEGLELLVQRLGGHDVLRLAVDLQTVDVNAGA